MTPFFENYPKDPEENLRWRIACRERALEDEQFRNAIYDACLMDVLFFMAFACIARGTLVVTNRGPVPIEQVSSRDLVWDGAEWVSQGGALYSHRPGTWNVRPVRSSRQVSVSGSAPIVPAHCSPDTTYLPLMRRLSLELEAGSMAFCSSAESGSRVTLAAKSSSGQA